MISLLTLKAEMLILIQAIESNMRATASEDIKLRIGISWGISVSIRTEVVEGQQSFVRRRDGCGRKLILNQIESAPERKSLESQQYLSARARANVVDQGEITTEQLGVKKISRTRNILNQFILVAVEFFHIAVIKRCKVKK